MADIPNRLPAPEKRKDKISKNDMRYLYRMDKEKKRSKRRAVIDKEIETEKRVAAKKRRQSVTNVKQITKAANQKIQEKKKIAKNQTPEEILLQQSRNVCTANNSIPCFFEDLPTTGGEASPPMTIDEIVAHEPDAIIWKELDYGHLVAHPKIWVFCTVCHLGMRSTEIGKIIYFPSYAKVLPDTGSRTAAVFKVAPTKRFLFLHPQCIDKFTF